MLTDVTWKLFLMFYKIFQDATKELKQLDEGMARIEKKRKQLATYFCESDDKFKLEECITTMKTFCERVVQCNKVSCRSLRLLIKGLSRALKSE